VLDLLAHRTYLAEVERAARRGTVRRPFRRPPRPPFEAVRRLLVALRSRSA
jgi:hypothetical protein